MIEDLMKNIDGEMDLLRDIVKYSNQTEVEPEKKKIFDNSISSLKKTMKTINSSIPGILENISVAKPLYSGEKSVGFEKVNVRTGRGTMTLTLDKNSKEKLINELNINSALIKKLKTKGVAEKETYEEFKSSRGYLKYSNRFFLQTAKRMIGQGNFGDLAIEIKKANMDLLLETYVAMMFFTSVLAGITGLFVALFLMFFSLSIDVPFITLYAGAFFPRAIFLIMIPIIAPIAVFFGLYYYPSTEKDSIAKKIEQELPFAVIHMSSISGSGIEPSEIFKIIGMSKEYPFLRREIRKVLNQINIYGYDLVTALNNVSKNTPSTKVTELFSGLATTIGSGGDLSEFFQKRAETLLLGYRLEREKYTHLAETFMDIYISVVIATPMILMLMLVILSVTAPDLGLSPIILTILIVTAVGMINTFFLIFLHIKQPSY